MSLRQLTLSKRNVSFGSQSDAGAATREILMSVLVTLHKRTPEPLAALTAALDALTTDPQADVYRLLFGSDTS